MDLFTSLKNILTGKWDGVLFTNDVTVNYFNSLSKVPHEVQYTKDIVRLQNPVFYFRKNSFVAKMFDEKIETCLETGLTHYWLTKYAHKRHKIKNREPIKLGINNILAIIQIAVAMYIISFIVFLLEIFSTEGGLIRKVLDYLTY